MDSSRDHEPSTCRGDQSSLRSLTFERRRLRAFADVLLDISDRLIDEGDRAYLGSTNDADLIRAVALELGDWAAGRGGA